MSRDFQYDVFLSHSSTDRDFVRDLDRKLRAIGVATFFDERDIPWGANIPQAIEEALDKSRHLILVLSPDSVGSDWVALERCVQIFEAPSGGERSILPLLYRDCDVLPPAVRIRRYLAVRSDEEFEQAWPQIVTFLTNDPPR